MIEETIVIEACNKVLDQIADGDMDGAIATISNLRADNQKKVDEFDKWAEEESKKQENKTTNTNITEHRSHSDHHLAEKEYKEHAIDAEEVWTIFNFVRA